MSSTVHFSFLIKTIKVLSDLVEKKMNLDLFMHFSSVDACIYRYLYLYGKVLSSYACMKIYRRVLSLYAGVNIHLSSLTNVFVARA